MKLIIQIPCFNEEKTLPDTIADLPNIIAGITEIETLIIDNGSTDRTIEIAREIGINHIIQLPVKGLANAFTTGLEACLSRGADIIVNTDADNQYYGDDIKKLIEPILAGRAEMVVGARNIKTHEEFSLTKKFLQRMGSLVVARASGFQIPDATSGFRAFTRDAALHTLVLGNYSYTLETLIQAGARKLRVDFVPVKTNPSTRPSRLMRGIPDYLTNSIATILRAYTMYRPLKVFSGIGLLFFGGGLGLGLRFLYFFMIGEGNGHIQSVILAAVLLIVGFQILLIGLMADLVGFNRKILEEILFRLRRYELNNSQPNPDDDN